jgi:hypothetical protein
VAAVALTEPAPAPEEVGQAYITPMATWTNLDGDRDKETVDSDVTSENEFDDGFQGGQLGIGFALEEHWNMEIMLQQWDIEDNNSSSGADAEQTGIVLNLLNLYNRDGMFSPYVLAGVGVNDVDGAEDQDDLQAQGGVGLMTDFFGERVAPAPRRCTAGKTAHRTGATCP